MTAVFAGQRGKMSEAARCVNTVRPLTRPLANTREGLAMKATQCAVPECSKQVHKRGFCAMHRSRMERTGTTDPGPQAEASLAERLWRRVDKTGDCWEWTGYRKSSGYGHISRGPGIYGMEYTHRVSWMLANEQTIPAGMMVLHSCDNPACVRPEHLRLGTVRENSQDMIDRQRSTAGRPVVRRDRCQRDLHDLTPDNVTKDRRCRECRLAMQRAQYAARKAA